MSNEEIRVESEITEDYCRAESCKKGVKIIGGWLEDKKALEFAEGLVSLIKNKGEQSGGEK